MYMNMNGWDGFGTGRRAPFEPGGSLFPSDRIGRLRVAVLVILFAVCVIFGGATRADSWTLMVVRPVTVICLAALLMLPGFRLPWRHPLVLLGLAFAATIAIQLLPLPPAIWVALPGHAQYAEAALAEGVAQPWRPISLAPDLALNSLFTWLVAWTCLIGVVGLAPDQRRALLPMVLVGAGLSALLGVFQLTGDANGGLYLYRVTHKGSAVGFFANRNHQAALLACCIPMLRVWTMMPVGLVPRAVRSVTALGMAILLVPVLLATGSRSGLALALVAAVAAYFVAPVKLRFRTGRRFNPFLVIPAIAVPMLAILMVVFGRALAIDRLTHFSLYSSEVRITNLSTVWDLVWRFFPTGSGFGSFDPIFRGFEQDAQLDETYFNHAHNELLELAMTGGLPALFVLVAFLLWWGQRSWAGFRVGARDLDAVFVRLGAIVVALMLAGGLVDYPLRTPAFAFLFALACAWLAGSSSWLQSPAGKGS